MSDKIIEIKGLYFKYKDEFVLEDISFSLDREEFFGIIGPNGSGKSTLLKLIAGILRPTKGEVKVYTDRISYIPQKVTSLYHLFPATVEEIVALGRLSDGIVKRFSRRDKELIDQALELVGLGEFKDRKLSELSGGQQQRVHIARAIVSSPELLILDEPTTGIDVVNQAKFYELLARLNRDMHITIIIVSHDISGIASEVSMMAYLDKKLHFIGKPRDFFRKIFWPVEIENLLRS
ncbi:metal ABC transporter ATP-binding protein [bacterium]|nr:metal ABC transporter ATP-binding protein [bacterium]